MTSKKKETTRRQRLIKALKIACYTVAWLLIWGTAAIILAVVGLLIGIQTVDQHNFTARDANNLVLVIIVVIAVIFFGTVWLLRKREPLFMRTSRAVLLVCTCLGLLIGVPVSLAGGWEPDNIAPSSQVLELNQAESIDSIDTESQESHTPSESSGSRSTTSGSQTTSTPSSDTKENSTSKAGCKYYSDIPYKTIEKTDSSMKEGQTRETNGYNGSRKVCTDSNGSIVSEDTTSTPIDKIIYHGTLTYEQAQSKAKSICNTTLPAGTPRNSTFYWDCVDRELKKIW